MDNHTSRKRICILSTRLKLGGITNVLLDTLQVLHDQYDIHIICCCEKGDTRIHNAFPDHVTIDYRPLPDKGLKKWIAKLPWLSAGIYKRLLGDDHWDHLLVLRPTLTNAVFAGKADNTVFWCHNDHYKGFTVPSLPLKKRIAKFFRRAVYKKYDMIWTVSDLIAEEMGNCFRLNNIYALPNPLNCRAIETKAQQTCDITLDQSKTNFIMIGRMSAEKGFHRVLHFMCQQVLPKHPGAQLYVMGTDTNDIRVQERVERFGVSDQVCLLGPKGNPYPYLKQAQFLICPSTWESFGLVILEAMLLGVRVITTDTVGGIYTTQNGTLAHCVPNTDQALQAAVEGYLQDINSYPYDMEKARQWAEAHDITRFAQTLQTLLQTGEAK